MLVLPGSTITSAGEVAERIRHAIASYVFEDGAKDYSITCSIGVASAKATDENFRKNALIRLADEALYQAKEDGRNRVVAYEPGKKKGWFGI